MYKIFVFVLRDLQCGTTYYYFVTTAEEYECVKKKNNYRS